MSQEIRIERMEASERDAVLLFLSRVYSDNPRQSDPEFWDWHFADPSSIRREKPLVWLAKSGDRIAGQLGAIAVDLVVNGESRTAIWILDMMVDPDFRRMGIAQRLVQAAESHCPTLLGVNTPEQHAPALLQKQGMVVVTKIPRFHRILFPGEAFREIASFGIVRRLTNTSTFLLRRKFTIDNEIEPIRGFDCTFDELSTRVKDQWPCHVSRSADCLEWQFTRQPGKTYETIGYFEGEELLGYAVLFFRKPNRYGAIEKAAISDICYDAKNGEKVVSALVRAALNLAIERRVGGIVTDVIDDLTQHVLSKHGFWKINSGLQLMVKSPSDQELVYNGANWFLTRGDSDISIFEHPNT